ncbi:hypothetical protein RhiirA5_431387 [Rhizophagus irregularis]|uniref:Uncharacterized protein n=1 Tax=Rhizophagus irregularis TaxID=588596 RepID=A0A2N0NV31_9GLOM|nr:hypothetical protein RhiirA5_431387 [Rhizophagus irregularis]
MRNTCPNMKVNLWIGYTLPEGEKERVLVVHDECIFYSNDGKRGLWTKNDIGLLDVQYKSLDALEFDE